MSNLNPIKHSPLLLMILDGWGIGENNLDNAIYQAQTPQWDQWCAQGIYASLDASGDAVGLPKNQMGNSEVGHMHIGAGRVIKQELTRINDDIKSGDFYQRKTLLNALKTIKTTDKTIHLMGLLSPGGVHSHQAHLYALLDCIHQQGIKNQVIIHAFLDGRDTPPNSGRTCLIQLQEKLTTLPNATIGSLCGRFYAMDRDKRWDRIESAYQLLTETQESRIDNINDFIKQSYQQEIYDEFIPATATKDHQPMQDGDLVIFFNFRADRARELSQALTIEKFVDFKRHFWPQINLLTMTEYQNGLKADLIYPAQDLSHTLGQCVDEAGFGQLRIAETEKYAHVTFFLNGGNELPFTKEDRLLIPSPKVKTYDLQPEMSAFEVTEKLVEAIHSEQYQLIVCNFANADMVGHTGNFEATKQAVEALDNCFIKINAALQTTSTNLIVTADHGNAEKMHDPQTEQPHTAHTNQDVPFVYVGNQPVKLTHHRGNLTDIAPTALFLLGIDKPADMTGQSMLDIREQK